MFREPKYLYSHIKLVFLTLIYLGSDGYVTIVNHEYPYNFVQDVYSGQYSFCSIPPRVP